MLRHPLTYTLSALTHPTSYPSCVKCVCLCGQQFRANVFQKTQKRNARPSPSVRRTQNRRSKVLKKDEAPPRDIKDELLGGNRLRQRLDKVQPGCGVETAMAFLAEFADLAQAQHDGATMDIARFQQLREERDITETDMALCCSLLLGDGESDSRALGKQLIFTLSEAGSELATIRIINNAYLARRMRPHALTAPELLPVRARLREMAHKGNNYHAMVLEGKCVHAAGDEETAVKLWTLAVTLAEEEAVARTERRMRPTEKLGEQQRSVDLEHLSSPWLDLTTIFRDRSDRDRMQWAVDIGCRLDDPISHFYAGRLCKRRNAAGEHEGTSDWLYHMTKAAGAGHPKACHELGVFYSTNGWKYIEDEPPNYVKPTPFDSYPSKPGTDRSFAAGNLWPRIRVAIGLMSPQKLDPREQIFHTAVFPSTPQKRLQMAMEWLRIACTYSYVPSFLYMARLYLEKNLWSLSVTPTDALELKDSRYTYASEADFQNNSPIHRVSPAEKEGEKDFKPKVRNPEFEPNNAKDFVRQVLLAAQAQRARARHLDATRARFSRFSTFLSDDDDADIFSDVDMPLDYLAFLTRSRVREMYSNDTTMKLYDDARDQHDLEAEAKAICDEWGWDIYAENGGLIYRHSKGKRGAGDKAAMAGG